VQAHCPRRQGRQHFFTCLASSVAHFGVRTVSLLLARESLPLGAWDPARQSQPVHAKSALKRALLAQGLTKYAGLPQREAATELGLTRQQQSGCNCADCERRWKKTDICASNGKSSSLIYLS